jgi:hypothetical protein
MDRRAEQKPLNSKGGRRRAMTSIISCESSSVVDPYSDSDPYPDPRGQKWSTNIEKSSVADPCHFGVDPDPDPSLWLMDPDPDSDPDPALFVIDLQDVSKKLIFEHNFFCLLLFEATFTSFFKDKKSKRVTNYKESRFFLLFLHDDRRIRIQSRIRIRIHTSD